METSAPFVYISINIGAHDRVSTSARSPLTYSLSCCRVPLPLPLNIKLCAPAFSDMETPPFNDRLYVPPTFRYCSVCRPRLSYRTALTILFTVGEKVTEVFSARACGVGTMR